MITVETMSRKAWGLGSIYQRKDGRWVGQTEHRGVRRYVYGRTPAEVRAKLRTAPPTAPRSSSIPTESLAAFIAEWLEIMQSKQAVRTHDGYAAIARIAIIPVLGDMPLVEIGRQDVERAISVWSENRHPRTVAHYRAALSAILAGAVEWGRITVNPARGKIRMPRIPDSTAAAFSEADEARFLAYVAGRIGDDHEGQDELHRRAVERDLGAGGSQAGPSQQANGEGVGRPEDGAPRAVRADRGVAEPATHSVDPLYPLWLAAFRTGMRQGELLGLTWKYVDFAAREIRVEQSLVRSKGEYRLSPPKTNKSRRTIPMGEGLAAVLEAHRKAQMARPAKLDQGLVFCTPAGGPLANDVVSRRFQALTREAKVTRLPMHSCRHTMATRLIQRGVNLMTVARLLGHTTITTTVNIYGHVSPDEKRSAIERLEVAL